MPGKSNLAFKIPISRNKYQDLAAICNSKLRLSNMQILPSFDSYNPSLCYLHVKFTDSVNNITEKNESASNFMRSIYVTPA